MTNPKSTLPSSAGISFHVLLQYNELETTQWEQWFRKQPKQVMDLPAGDAIVGLGTVRDLLFHIFIVECVYAKVLQGEPWEDELQQFDRSSCEGIFRVAAVAQRKLRAFVESASDAQLERDYTINARSGQAVSGSGTKFLTHIVLHSTRHWAQMAALMRQHGHKTDWQHDFICSNVMK